MSGRRSGVVLASCALRVGWIGGVSGRNLDLRPQQTRFDATGDTRREVFFTEIRDGRFVALK